ncbi:MAG: uroporphyrinogen decarboxylase family protein, partial [Armatimonadota bacterium]|nr:uroporphyrinogen decarboxylase family protein [Armatimonadota bacterium]
MRKLKWTTHSDLAIRKHCDVRREEYLDHMTFRRNERPLFTEIFGPLVGLKEEWEEQGATPEELDFSAFRYRCPMLGGVPVNTGWIGGQPPETLEETEHHLVFRDAMGRTMKLAKNVSTLPLPMDWPVKTMDDWLRVKPHYQFSEARFRPGWQETARRHLQAGRAVTVSIPGGYDTPRQLMGDEAACIAFLDQPELIHDILQTVQDTAVKVLDRVSAAVPVDILTVHEDMAGRSGPMVGPAQVRAFIAPYYRRVWEMLADRGARLFDQDSDGNMNPVIDAFLEAGVNCMHPMEPAAGMDIVAIRAKYGKRLAFYGGIDKHVLRRSLA